MPVDPKDLDKYDWSAFGKQGGRPSKYSNELAQQICMFISGGIPLQAICRRDDMPAISTVLQWVVDNRKELSTDEQGFSDLYTKAREAQGYYDADNIRDVANRALDGELDASIARVAIDGFKWTAERNAGRTFGQKQSIDQTIKGNMEHTHDHGAVGDAVVQALLNKSKKDDG